MRYFDGIKPLIGNTPLVKLNNLGISPSVGLFAKLELWNPGGSLKDRIGVSMLKDAEESGRLKPGGTIIEATAGNTGLGIAIAALGTGYRIVFVVPTKFSAEKLSLMRALGAEVVSTPREEGMLGARQKAEELKRGIPGAISLEQFENPANPKIHYETTGPEIYRDLDGKIDYFVAGAGSGGTFSGALRYLKERNKEVRGVLADPAGSILGGGEHADYNIEGIGNDFVPATMDMSLIDDVVKVTDDEAFAAAKLIARAEGIFAGISAGAALHAAIATASRAESSNVVVILPDRGDRYFSKGIYD
jgi:cysteine synthase A